MSKLSNMNEVPLYRFFLLSLCRRKRDVYFMANRTTQTTHFRYYMVLGTVHCRVAVKNSNWANS